MLMRSQALMKQTKAEITPAVGSLITERHREDIAWLLEHFQVDLSNDGATQDREGLVHDKPRANSEGVLESVLNSYDEKILEELLFFCLHESLSGRIRVRSGI
jgi:hypothetical protein